MNKITGVGIDFAVVGHSFIIFLLMLFFNEHFFDLCRHLGDCKKAAKISAHRAFFHKPESMACAVSVTNCNVTGSAEPTFSLNSTFAKRNRFFKEKKEPSTIGTKY